MDEPASIGVAWSATKTSTNETADEDYNSRSSNWRNHDWNAWRIQCNISYSLKAKDRTHWLHYPRKLTYNQQNWGDGAAITGRPCEENKTLATNVEVTKLLKMPRQCLQIMRDTKQIGSAALPTEFEVHVLRSLRPVLVRRKIYHKNVKLETVQSNTKSSSTSPVMQKMPTMSPGRLLSCLLVVGTIQPVCILKNSGSNQLCPTTPEASTIFTLPWQYHAHFHADRACGACFKSSEEPTAENQQVSRRLQKSSTYCPSRKTDHSECRHSQSESVSKKLHRERNRRTTTREMKNRKASKWREIETKKKEYW